MKLLPKLFLLAICALCFQTANAGWTKVASANLTWYKDVFFVNHQTGWIAGSGGTVLETTDGGKTWNQLKKFTDDTIRQVYFSDAQNGWLLCERDRFNRGTGMPVYAMHTTDGGLKWEKTEFAKEGREFVTRIVFDKFGNATAFGEGGVFFSLQADQKTWKKTAYANRYLMLDGTFTGDMDGVIVGGGGTILFTDDAGVSWNHAGFSGGDQTAKLTSVFFINPKSGWAAGAGGKIFQTIGGGKTWREQKSGTTADLNSIFFISTAEGWAVGDDGKILHTQTAGNVWVPESSNTTHRLEKVFFTGKTGWAVGFGGTILTFN